MICNSCNKENRADGKFCRFCGSKLGQTKNSITIKLPDFKGLLNNLVDIIRKQNKKAIIIVVLVVGIGAGTVFAGPKVNDYIKVNKSISESIRLGSIGDYNAALAALTLTSDKWTFESKRQEIESLKETQSKYAQFKESSETALEKEESGKLAEARELLQSIGSDYPEYEKIRERLNTIQEGIENNLKEQARLKELEAQRQSAAAAAARQQAAADSAARTRAEAEKAASDAQSRAAAQSARDAEVRKQQAEAQAQQEAAQRAEEVRKSFYNQLVSGYNSYNSGVSYYSSAISYSNNGDSLLALSQANAARAVLNTARNSVSDLNSSFTGLSSDYYAAADNMVNAIDYLNRAINLLVQSEGTSLDYSSSINSNKNLATTYAARVKSFLDSN